jgi:hypothetical protein
MILLVSACLFLFCVIIISVVLQYRRSVRQYTQLAELLCDPDSWKIRFYVRTVVLSGRVGGLPIRYSVLGNPKGEALAPSYLLLLCPVVRNLRVYAESNLSLVDEEIREGVEVLQRTEGFRSVIFTPAGSPMLGKFLSRPPGFTYEPGLLLCKLETGGLNAETIRSDVGHLDSLSKMKA